MQELRANTAVDVLIGPFVDETDGITTLTATITQADVLLSKLGQTLTQKTDANAAVHDAIGYHNCPLDATDTNTEGMMTLVVHESGALPVRHEYMVLAEASWDSKYEAKDTGYMNVDIQDGGAAVADAVCDELLSGGEHRVKNSLADYIRKAKGGETVAIYSGDVVSATVNTVVFESGTESADGVYEGNTVAITSGTGLGQTRAIMVYTGAGREAVVDKNWSVTPDGTSKFDILAATGSVYSDDGVAQAGGVATITLATTASDEDDIYNGSFVKVISGTGSGQTKITDDYAGASRLLTVSVAWATVPDNTSVYVVIPRSTSVSDGGTTGSGLTLSDVETGAATAIANAEPIDANMTQLVGVAQSATDLKDFADTGYDPGTNKVQGVVLVDTTTTNTDMVGTDGANTVVPDAAGVAPTAVENRTEMDSNSTQLAAIVEDTGTTLPAQISQIGSGGGSAANEFVIPSPNGFVITTGTGEVNNEDSTVALDGVLHQVSDSAGTLDVYYLCDIGAGFNPTNIIHDGRMNGNNQDADVYVNTNTQASPTWVQRATLIGSALGTNARRTWPLASGDVMVGADAGKVAVRFQNTGLTSATLSTDQVLVEKTSIASLVGYADGAVWVDTNSGNTGTIDDVDGVADNPVGSWADALTVSASKNLLRFRILSGSMITLSANSDGYALIGVAWTLDLNGQSIVNTSFIESHTTGIGITGPAHFTGCHMGACTIPPSFLTRCGFGENSGTLTAGSAGEYVIEDGYSQVPGAGSPAFVFTGLGSATGISNRGWKGGATWTLDSNCILSHEVLAGGGTTITTGGGDAEIRGITRSLTLTMSAAETVQFVGTTGPIILNGTTTATVNLHGVSSSLVDNTSAAVVSDNTVSQTNIDVDAAGTAASLHSTTDGKIDTTDALVTSSHSTTDGLVNGVPTTAEFNARTILAASYFDPTADPVANVTLVDTTTTNTDMVGTNAALLAADVNVAAGVVESNIVQLGGVAQSATDLKDFADAGYDPITNKVQGVVLVDTTTTNTDMVGTNGANTTVPDAAGVAATLHGTTDALITTETTAVESVVTASHVTTNGILGTPANIDLGGATIADNLKKIVDDNGGLDFNAADESLTAIRARGDIAWSTSSASVTQVLNVQPLIPLSIDLADTATVRLGLMLVNSVDDLPSTVEITPGTISIDRKAIGGTSWSSVVLDAACSESAGLVYYDEVFDSGTTYAEGDSIRITFKSQDVVADANTHEITGAVGIIFYTEIRATMVGTNGANTTVPDAAGTAAGLHSTTDALVTTETTAVEAVVTAAHAVTDAAIVSGESIVSVEPTVTIEVDCNG